METGLAHAETFSEAPMACTLTWSCRLPENDFSGSVIGKKSRAFIYQDANRSLVTTTTDWHGERPLALITS